MAYEHLKFSREVPIPERHKTAAKFQRFRPENPRAYGADLRRTFDAAKQSAIDELAGYDDRILFKVQLRDDAAVPELGDIPGVELVSQEDKSIVLAFADPDGLANFENRLSCLARDGKATRAELLYALQGFDHWTSEDRKGAALRQQGFPDVESFVIDVELWPLERPAQRDALLKSFLETLQERGIEKLDDLNLPSLVMVRVRCTKAQAESVLLKHRDVRMVDLLPRRGVTFEVLLTDINQIPQTQPPPENAAPVAVLDSGLTTGHPVLASVVTLSLPVWRMTTRRTGTVLLFPAWHCTVMFRNVCGKGSFFHSYACFPARCSKTAIITTRNLSRRQSMKPSGTYMNTIAARCSISAMEIPTKSTMAGTCAGWPTHWTG
jgi:hypothetical protein